MGSDEKDMARLWCDFQSLTHENRESAMAKAGTVAGEMEERKLKSAANRLREGVGETAACLLPGFPANHGIKLRTDNMIERLNKEIRRRTRVVGGFPDSNSWPTANLRKEAGTRGCGRFLGDSHAAIPWL